MWRNRTCKRYRYSGMGSGRGSENQFQQKAGNMTPRIPINYIVQIDNFHLGEFIFYWNYYGQPCSLLLQKPKTEGLTAIKLVVDSDETASFLLRAKEKTGCRLYQVD
nr:MAG TPA: hypothetical protein [Caudoviricetes sp.]